jgi:hypothetical protein
MHLQRQCLDPFAHLFCHCCELRILLKQCAKLPGLPRGDRLVLLAHSRLGSARFDNGVVLQLSE